MYGGYIYGERTNEKPNALWARNVRYSRSMYECEHYFSVFFFLLFIFSLVSLILYLCFIFLSLFPFTFSRSFVSFHSGFLRCLLSECDAHSMRTVCTQKNSTACYCQYHLKFLIFQYFTKRKENNKSKATKATQKIKWTKRNFAKENDLSAKCMCTKSKGNIIII